MKFILRNNSVIRPITNSEYEAEFGLTFRDFKDLVRLSEMGQDCTINSPWLFDSVRQLLEDVMCDIDTKEVQCDFEQEDVERLIEAQTNDRYKNAIRKYAIEIGLWSEAIKPVKMAVTASAATAVAA